jgi:hypothetical protein
MDKNKKIFYSFAAKNWVATEAQRHKAEKMLRIFHSVSWAFQSQAERCGVM